MIARLLGAVQFLTVLPVRRRAAPPGQAAIFFPLVGAWMGWFGAALLLMLEDALTRPAAAMIVLGVWTVVAGGLHEDGLADVADAFRAGRSPQRILEILKDSRIGTFGALALVFSVLLRWQALSAIPAALALPGLVAVQALSRTVMVCLGWIARPVGSGLGAAFCATMTTPVALAAIAQAAGAALWCGPRLGIVMLAVTVLVVALARRFFHRGIGGVTGDCLGAAGHVSEIVLLVLLACRNCTW